MAASYSSIHASTVLAGPTAVLIRGPSGCGKSRLAWELIEAAAQGALPFARLVADDRTYVEGRHGRLLVRPADVLAGLLEIRGLGIRRLPYEPLAVAGLVVDLAATDADRLPQPRALEATLEGLTLPRLPVPAGAAALPAVVAFLRTVSAAN